MMMHLEIDPAGPFHLSMKSKLFYALYYLNNMNISKYKYLNTIYNEFKYIDQNLETNLIFRTIQDAITKNYSITVKTNYIRCHVYIYHNNITYRLKTERLRRKRTIATYNSLDEAKAAVRKRIKRELKKLNYETKLEELMLKEL